MHARMHLGTMGLCNTIAHHQVQEINMKAIRWLRSSGSWTILAAMAALVVASWSHSQLGILIGWVCLGIGTLYAMFAAPDATGRDS